MSEHTCIKDDGGTPNRRCYACEEEKKTPPVFPSGAEETRAAARMISADEFEHLALMGRTKAGDLIVGEGGAERVLAHAKRLALSPDDVMDIYVPGRLRCPKCTFQLTKATLFVQSGQIGASKAEVYQQPEPCPNDGTFMDRVTWREESDANRSYAERLIDELLQATGMESLPAAMEIIKASRASKDAEPSATLNECWELFAEEFAAIRERSPLQFALMAFFAGAQSFCSATAAALGDEITDEQAASLIDGLHAELMKACEELKI